MNESIIDEIDLKHVFFTHDRSVPLVLEKYSFLNICGDYVVLLAREYNCRRGVNCGDLMCGIIKREKENINGEEKTIWKTILPFSKTLLRAEFLNEKEIRLVRYYEKHLETKNVFLKEDGTLDEKDYSYLFLEDNKNQEDGHIKEPERILRPKKKFFHLL